MKLSKKGRYAVTAIMDLVLKAPFGPTTLNNISVSQEISMSYMEQLFARLRKHDLVQGTRGPGGGYRLARPANEITIAQVLEAVDDDANALNNGNKSVTDLSHLLWDELSRKVALYLDSITIQDLLDQSGYAEEAARANQSTEKPLAGVIEQPNTLSQTKNISSH